MDVQLHLWPWSKGIREETFHLAPGETEFPFWGSPVVSVSARAQLFLPRRHERFSHFGPPFDTLAGEYRLYEAPHGVLASGNSQPVGAGGEIRLSAGNMRTTLRLSPTGARPRFEVYDEGQEQKETDLARTVVAWSQFFDDLLDDAGNARRGNRVSWSQAIKRIHRIAEDAKQPRKALIVDIADQMGTGISQIVAAVRRILNRERVMLSADRMTETDTACLRWLVRQPGKSMAQKAAANRQRLLGVARRESFDTLENRVLKDFLFRCSMEGRRYLKTEVGDNLALRQSVRARLVRQYQYLCSSLSSSPVFDEVAFPPNVPVPNYVLQNDGRYRKVWKNYLRLLKREDEEDCLWDWQSRTWADVCRFLVCSSVFSLSQEGSERVFVEELQASMMQLAGEQRLGGRIMPGSEPGPFLVGRKGASRGQATILEIVHPDQAGEHPSTRLLGRMGGHLYIVLTPLHGRKPVVLVVWAVHTAAAENHPPWSDIGRLAGQALRAHSVVLYELGEPTLPRVQGFVVASDMQSKAAELHPGSGNDLHLIQVATDQRCWKDALSGISIVIEDILESVL